MHKIVLVITVLFILAGCTKEIFLIEAPEAIPENLPPNDFTLSVNNVTDSEIVINWTLPIDPEGESVNFDIALNDSVIEYDIARSDNYIISNLFPETDYNISVIAHDENYNKTVISTNVKTLKSFIQSFHPIDLEYESIAIYGSTETNEGGFLICGIGSGYDAIRNDYHNFVAKINSDYSVAWEKQFAWDFRGKMSAMECSDGSYIVIWTNTVIKLDNWGEILWTYNCSPDYNIEFLSSITETNNGEFLLTGYKIDNQIKYSVIKLNQFGKETWHKWGGTTTDTRADYITTTNNGKILILGTVVSMSFDGQEKTIFWLLQLDESGDFIKENIYTNKFDGSDVVHSLEITSDGNYLLTGSTNGYIGGYGKGFVPHIIKTNTQGDVIWEKFPPRESTGGGNFRILKDIINIESNNCLIYISDDLGCSIATMDEMGEIIKYKKLNGFPDGRKLTINQIGEYILLTDYGIFVLDPNGYYQ